MPRSPGEVDAWIDKHEAEHEAFELRVAARARHEMTDVVAGVKSHVDAATAPILEQLSENARYRSEKAAREQLELEAKQKLATRKTKAEIALKEAQRRATWIRIAILAGGIVIGAWIKTCHGG